LKFDTFFGQLKFENVLVLLAKWCGIISNQNANYCLYNFLGVLCVFI